MSWIGDASSLGDLFFQNCDRFGSKTAYQWVSSGSVKTLTYSDVRSEVYRYARALVSCELNRGDYVALACETCIEWALADWACQTLGLVLVPIYPTLPADQASYIADDCQAKVVLVQDERQAVKFPNHRVETLKGEKGLLAHDSNLTIEDWVSQVKEVQRTDIATVIYTSGTTGQPKGAMLTHAGFLDLTDAIHERYGIGESDTFLSFLPLAHVFERYAGHFLAYSVGATISYAGSIASLSSDLSRFQPTIMCAVPRFFENLRAKILDGVAKEPPLKRKLFDLAMSQGLAKYEGRFAPLFGLTDKLVGSKIRAKTGGRIRFFASGGAALAPQVGDFFNSVGLTVLQGYGLTETTAATCLNLPKENKPWTVGPPIPGVEVKIASDGEILTRGTSVMTGYLRLPDATAEVIDAEGWFHTGDIGEFEGTSLKITDRKKDILVLGNGKNIAPQKIEAKLKESEYINEAVLFGDGMEHCVALIVPEFERAKHWLKLQGIVQDDPAQIVQVPEFKNLIKSEIDSTNKSLADFERVKKHALIGSVFSVETGELTPSMKVKRKAVKEKYSTQLEGLRRSG